MLVHILSRHGLAHALASGCSVCTVHNHPWSDLRGLLHTFWCRTSYTRTAYPCLSSFAAHPSRTMSNSWGLFLCQSCSVERGTLVLSTTLWTLIRWCLWVSSLSVIVVLLMPPQGLVMLCRWIVFALVWCFWGVEVQVMRCQVCSCYLPYLSSSPRSRLLASRCSSFLLLPLVGGHRKE